MCCEYREGSPGRIQGIVPGSFRILPKEAATQTLDTIFEVGDLIQQFLFGHFVVANRNQRKSLLTFSAT